MSSLASSFPLKKGFEHDWEEECASKHSSCGLCFGLTHPIVLVIGGPRPNHL
jgi:hypothetical protein